MATENPRPDVFQEHAEHADAGTVTELLAQYRGGAPDVLDRLVPLLYRELRKLANCQIRASCDETLAPTELVHEMYMRLASQDALTIESRAHFSAIAAHVMRCVLVDRARMRGAQKRAGGRIRVNVEAVDEQAPEADLDLMAVDDALNGLSAVDPLKGRIVEMRFFGGLKIEEIADALSLSQRTVARHWVMAKAWLYSEMQRRTRG